MAKYVLTLTEEERQTLLECIGLALDECYSHKQMAPMYDIEARIQDLMPQMEGDDPCT